MACHHRPSTTHTVGRRRAWHDLTALGQHTRSDYVRCGMTSLPLYSTHGRTTSGVACHHRLWTTHTVGNVGHGLTSPPLNSTHGQQCRAWHDISAFGQHTRSNNVGVAYHHRLRKAHTVKRRRAWHAIIAFRKHTRSNDVGRGRPSSPLD